jgi:hypothetical protein
MKRVENYHQDTLEILHHVSIGEANGLVASCFKKTVPAAISPGVVRPTVDFDDQAFRRTEEIGDEWRSCDLAPELEPTQLRIAQVPPEPNFRFGRTISKFSGARL